MEFLEIYLLIGLSWGISGLIIAYYRLLSNSQSKQAIYIREKFQSLVDELADFMDVNEAVIGAFILTLTFIYAIIYQPIAWPYLICRMIKKSLNKNAEG